MAAPAATIATLGSALKRKYSEKFVTSIEWSHGVAAAQVKKVAWHGFPTWAMRVGNSAARSADFPTAQTLAASAFTNVVQPVIPTYQQDFGVATIEGRLMKAAGGKDGALYDKMVAQIDGIMGAVMHSLSTKIYRNGFGGVSTINATTVLASTLLVLAFPEDAVLFEIGDQLTLAASDAAAQRAGTISVTGIDYTAGTLTLSGNITAGIAAAALGDTIYHSGDRGAGASPAAVCISGYEQWLNSSTALFGLTRTNDGRLRGYSFSAQGMTEEDALIQGLAETRRFGGQVDAVYMNPTRMRNIIKLAMGRYRPITVKGPAGIGFKEGIALMTLDGREVNCFDDPFCPYLRIFGIETKSFQLFCADSDKIPAFLDDDGLTVLRLAAADGVEGRVGYYADLGCNAPIHNFVATYTS